MNILGLLNRLGDFEHKSQRVSVLIHHHLWLVQKRQANPLTKEQCYRLRALEMWYKMHELTEEARKIATTFGFTIKTEL
jgi:hypothetical protein